MKTGSVTVTRPLSLASGVRAGRRSPRAGDAVPAPLRAGCRRVEIDCGSGAVSAASRPMARGAPMAMTTPRPARVPAARASEDEPRLRRTGSSGPAERAQHGKNARALVPRAEQGNYDPSTRAFDPVDVLERQSAMRVPELV